MDRVGPGRHRSAVRLLGRTSLAAGSGTPLPPLAAQSTDRLTQFPRLYEAAPVYGEGVRRISLLGQHVLYEVNDAAQRDTILAVVGQRQNPKSIR